MIQAQNSAHYSSLDPHYRAADVVDVDEEQHVVFGTELLAVVVDDGRGNCCNSLAGGNDDVAAVAGETPWGPPP